MSFPDLLRRGRRSDIDTARGVGKGSFGAFVSYLEAGKSLDFL